MSVINVYGAGTDDTAAVQAAVNAAKAGDTVRVPEATTCRINPIASPTLYYSSRTGIALKSGITFQIDGTLQAIPNAADHYVILLAQNVDGLVITGKGKIIGDRGAGNPVVRGAAGQWGFGIGLGPAAKNVTINGGLTVSQCFGDGLTAIGASNLTINDVVFDSNYRQNASLIDVNGVKITNSTFSNAGQSNLDLEPAWAGQNILNVAVDFCDFVNCGTLFPIGATKAHIGVGSSVGTFKGIRLGADNQFDIKEQPIFVSGNAGSGGTPPWAAALNRIFYETLKADWYRFWGYPTSWSD
jgi:hypothetical protein